MKSKLPTRVWQEGVDSKNVIVCDGNQLYDIVIECASVSQARTLAHQMSGGIRVRRVKRGQERIKTYPTGVICRMY